MTEDSEHCKDCKEHVRFEEKFKHGTKIMDRHEQFMTDQTKRSFHILVGVIMTLIASLIGGAVSISITMYDHQKKTSQAVLTQSEQPDLSTIAFFNPEKDNPFYLIPIDKE